jgi:hypothetical protein
MKFFSNEAKENDPGYDRSDVATSEPVAVPQQRAGSPWNDTPGESSTDYREPQHRSDDPDSPSDVDSASDADLRDDRDLRDEDAEIAEQELRDGTDERPENRPEEPEAEQLSEPITTTYGPDGTVTHSDDPVDLDLDDSRTDDPADTGETKLDEVKAEDEAIKDEGTFDSPEAVEPATGEAIDDEDDNHGKEPKAVEDHEADADYDAPVAVDPEPVPALGTDEPAADEPASDEPVVAAVPVGATPGSLPATPVDRLFADGDAFGERFRDIQLRFVDSPKEAVADAATLVGEAVDKLTAALSSQKDALGGDSDDTEQLRVQLRGYRDLLNRLTGL